MAPPMQIAAAAMAPDASWAITVSADGTVRTWGTGVPPREIRRAVLIDGSQPVAVALAGDRDPGAVGGRGGDQVARDREGDPVAGG